MKKWIGNRLLIEMTQFYLRTFRPILLGMITKFIYFGSNVSFGKNYRVDSIPRILIDKKSKLIIGDDVELRRDVEMRIHGMSTLEIGNDVRIDRGVRLLSNNNAFLKIGNGSRIGLYAVFNGGDSIVLGEKVLISGFVYLQTSMHRFKDKEGIIRDQGFEHAPVKLEEGAWLGAHVVVLPGVVIKKGAVVGSNAVVNKNVEAYEVVGGLPAKKLNERT